MVFFLFLNINNPCKKIVYTSKLFNYTNINYLRPKNTHKIN